MTVKILPGRYFEGAFPPSDMYVTKEQHAAGARPPPVWGIFQVNFLFYF